MDKILCFKCNKKIAGIRKFTNHYRQNHGIMVSRLLASGFYCRQQKCNKHFIRYDSFIRHLKKHHIIQNSPRIFDHDIQEKKIEDFRQCKSTDESKNVCFDEVTSIQKLMTPTQSEESFDISSSAIRMVANLRASSSFTGAALGKVINAADFLVSNILDYTKSEILKFLKKKDIELEDPEVTSFLEKFDFNNLFKNMDTAEGQIEALKKCYNYIEATEIPLGHRIDQRLDSKSQFWQQKQVYETFQYVSIIETLKLITSHEDVWNYIESEKSASDDWLCNFRDGVTFKTHKYFQKYPNALRIQLYYDDIVVNNPLGSKVQSHKIGAFYYVIQNLPPHLNSYLGGIHVLALCHTADIEKYGMDAILRPFMHDLRILESDEGILVSENEKERVLRASLAAVTADGLAAHQLFGLMSPAALYFCRLCMINRWEFQKDEEEETSAISRTKQLHDEHIKIIEEKVTQKDIENARKQCGVKEISILHESQYFYFTNNYIFDPMHDIFEGVAPMEIKLVLNHFITNKEYDLNVDTLNARLHLFQYGLPEVKNKPSANFTLASLRNLQDYKLKQTAAQTWCLMRVLPFIVSDKVSENDKYLYLILLLCRITEIVFARKLTVTILRYFSELIVEHDILFRELFPDIHRINKHHHLHHYPECIKRSGPLRWMSCFRFEAKHSILKKQGSVCCNYKNIPKTMINHCQISQCAIWGTGTKPREKIKYTKSETVKIVHTLSKIKLNEIGLQDEDYVIKVDKIEMYGIEYRIGLFVAIDGGKGNDNGDPEFGRIKEILLLEGEQIYLWCEVWVSLWLAKELNAYCVGPDSCFKLINTNDLCDFKPFSLWMDYKSSYCYIVLRHFLL